MWHIFLGFKSFSSRWGLDVTEGKAVDEKQTITEYQSCSRAQRVWHSTQGSRHYMKFWGEPSVYTRLQHIIAHSLWEIKREKWWNRHQRHWCLNIAMCIYSQAFPPQTVKWQNEGTTRHINGKHTIWRVAGQRLPPPQDRTFFYYKVIIIESPQETRSVNQ